VSQELLDLSQIAAPRDTIRLPSKKDPAGHSYEIVNPNDLGILALQRFYQLQEEENRLRASAAARKSGELTPAQSRVLRKCLGDAIKILMPSLDDATLNALPTEARERIIIAWTAKHYSAELGDEASAEGEAPSRRTGVASSRGSKKSTAATRSTGS
jgi:hypothetical protein